MWGGMPGYGGAAAPPDPRKWLAMAIAIVAVFFGLPLFIELTGGWARDFITAKYGKAFEGAGILCYWLLSGFAMLAMVRTFIWYGAGIGVALLARMLSRTR